VVIRYKNEGAYVRHEQTGAELSFRGGELTVDLEKERRGYPFHIDISEDEDGALVTGPSRRYVAEIDIPARAYRLNYKGYADDLGIVQVFRTVTPFDPDEVVLTLWALAPEE
jgi:hypothetical protein